MYEQYSYSGEPRNTRIPRADEVAYCPPHYWVVEESWEECKKCGERRQNNRPYQAIKIL